MLWCDAMSWFFAYNKLRQSATHDACSRSFCCYRARGAFAFDYANFLLHRVRVFRSFHILIFSYDLLLDFAYSIGNQINHESSGGRWNGKKCCENWTVISRTLHIHVVQRMCKCEECGRFGMGWVEPPLLNLTRAKCAMKNKALVLFT